jgi:threonyl-tRNA synthetase
MKKVPLIIVVGEKEEQESLINIRKHGGENLGSMTVEEFAKQVKTEIQQTLKSFK